jgi:hypothetical protein
MKKFIIERILPGAGNLTPDELEAMSKTSNATITMLNKSYQWVQSFVTEDKIYCVHEAESADDIREHANCAGFPANRIEEIKVIINPTTAGS